MKRGRKHGRNLPRIPRPKHSTSKSKSTRGGVTSQGVVSVSSNGYGFVTLEGNKKKDVFIPARDMNGAFNGDFVEIVTISDRDLPAKYAGKGATGRIVKILKRKIKGFVGEVMPNGMVMPLSKKLSQPVPVAGGLHGAHVGEWVDVTLYPADSDHGPRVSVDRVIGEAGTIAADLDAVVANYDLPAPYTEADELASMNVEPLDIPRETLDVPFCATLDPTDAKDHDDALSLESTPDGKHWILGVHIADVAAYIKPGTKWDREARRRSFTSYLPGRTLPMLPRKLTAKISLTPGHPSAAQSVFFTIDKRDCSILEFRTAFTWVTITHSLDYDAAQAFIDTGKGPWDNDVCAHLNDLVALTRVMRRKRLQDEQFLELAVPEIRPILDDGAERIDRIERRIQRESEMLVEECMLAANTAVAHMLHEKHIPAIYRVHDEPEPEALDEFTAQMHEFGLNPGTLLDRTDCNHFFESVMGEEHQAMVMNAFVRVMPRAMYDAECRPHFGLGKHEYLHFTSPIRRYPDLLTHRQLHALAGHGKLLSGASMLSAAEECTEKESVVDEAYYSASDRLKLHYLKQVTEREPGRVWPASINRIVANGVSVEILELGLYGFVENASLMIERKVKEVRGKARRARERVVHDEVRLTPGRHVDLILARLDFTKGIAYFAPADLKALS